MKRTLGLLLVLSLAVSTVVAEETEPATADKLAAVNRLLDLTGAVQMGQQIINQLLTLHQQSHPDVPAQAWAEIRAELDFNDFKPALAQIYDAHFSAAEINALIAFYESDIGRQLLAKQPEILNDSIAAGQSWAGEVQGKLVETLKRKGYAEGL